MIVWIAKLKVFAICSLLKKSANPWFKIWGIQQYKRIRMAERRPCPFGADILVRRIQIRNK